MANPKDARLRELQLLARIDRLGSLELPSTKELDPRERGMIAELIYDRFLNGVGSPPWTYEAEDLPAWVTLDPDKNTLLRQIEHQRWYWLNRVFAGREVSLRMTHKGRVRLAELEQALKTGRDRDPTGIMIGK